MGITARGEEVHEEGGVKETESRAQKRKKKENL